MIIFRKILSYELKPKVGDVFEYLSSLTRQVIDPPSLGPIKLELKSGVVLHSTLRRCVECIKRDDGVEYVALEDLNEIAFDIDRLCGKEAWEKEGSVVVRKAFKKGFIEDTLLVSRKEIFDGVRRVLSLCCERSVLGDVSVVSHSFRLAIIEAYIDTQGGIERDPALIHKYISDDKKRYEFGGGFECDVSDIAFVIN